MTPPLAQRLCPSCRSASFAVLLTHRDRYYHRGGPITVVQCARCGVVSYDPLPTPEELATYYPSDYYAYREEPDAPPQRSGLRARLDDLHLGIRPNLLLAALLWPLLWYKEVYSYARFLRPIPRGRLLDVGCGDGAFLLKAQRMGFACAGLEPWGNAARATLERAGIPFHQMPLEQLDPALGTFDVITLNHVFEHLTDPDTALQALRKLLAPGGRLLVRMPSTDQILFRRWPQNWFQLEMPRHIYLFTPRNFATLAARQGFRVERVIGEFYPTHLQHFLKASLFRRDFSEAHWIDSTAISFALLPVCALLRLFGQADCMAVWLRPEDAGR